jgi:hypothetical protein
METQDKKYSITLDRSIYESNDLNQLKKLAIDYCIEINEGLEEYNANGMIKISSIEKHDWEADNIYSLIYDNLMEIEVNINALDCNDWEYLISELAKVKFHNVSYINDECDSIANVELDLIIYLPNEEYNYFTIDKYFDNGFNDKVEPKTFDSLVELVKEINNLKK